MIEETKMATKCFLSGKKPVTLKKKVSHSHIRTNRKVRPNLQTVTILVGNNKKKVKVSTKMIKKGKTIGLKITKQQYKAAKRSATGLLGKSGLNNEDRSHTAVFFYPFPFASNRSIIFLICPLLRIQTNISLSTRRESRKSIVLHRKYQS